MQQYHPNIQQTDPQLDGLDSSSVRQLYEHHLSNVEAQRRSLIGTAPGPCEPDFRIDVLPNQTLFLMVQDWQDLIDCGDEGFVWGSPGFHELMSELVKRGLVNVDWRWAVDVDRVDMDYARVMDEGLNL